MRPVINFVSTVCAYSSCPREGEPFNAFRETAKFCSDTCRFNAHQESTGTGSFRAAVMRAFDGLCMVDGEPIRHRSFIWRSQVDPDDPTDAVLLCGRHHAYVSMSAARRASRVKWLQSKGLPVPPELLDPS